MLNKTKLKVLLDLTEPKATPYTLRFTQEKETIEVCLFNPDFSATFLVAAEEEELDENPVLYKFAPFKQYLKNCKAKNKLHLDKHKVTELDPAGLIQSQVTDLNTVADEASMNPQYTMVLEDFDFTLLKLLDHASNQLSLLQESQSAILRFESQGLSIKITNGYSIFSVFIPALGADKNPLLGKSYRVPCETLKNIGKCMESETGCELIVAKDTEDSLGLFFVADTLCFCRLKPIEKSIFDKIGEMPEKRIEIKPEVPADFFKSFAAYRKQDKSMKSYEVNLRIEDGKMQLIGSDAQIEFPALPFPVMLNAYDFADMMKKGIDAFCYNQQTCWFEGKNRKMIVKRL